MANKLEKKKSLRLHRYFSESIKQQVVKDIEAGKSTVLQASRELNVNPTNVYRWLNKYSSYLKSQKRLVVEENSELYRSQQLEKENQKLLAIIGKMQVEKEYTEKLIEEAGKHYGDDLKKSFGTSPLPGSGKIKK